MMIFLGVDTGGTFTDLIFIQNNELITHKVPSTPDNPAEAILEGIEDIFPKYDDINVIHGSTVATNAFLERKGKECALLTTKGFEDVIFIGRGNRKELYNINYSLNEPFIHNENIYGITERTNKFGEIQTEINEKGIKKIAKRLKQRGIYSAAIVFLFSFFNSKNEIKVKEILNDEGIDAFISSEVCPEYREFERTSTTVINTYLSPVMSKYLNHLKNDINGKLSIMHSAGGIISPDEAGKYAIKTLLSGPAGGVYGAFSISKLTGIDKIITFDMGGTSTDVSICDNEIITRNQTYLEGMPIKTSVIDIHTIGAGGGSIAYLDSGGALCVGPESAGAFPGPICYNRTEEANHVTVTDANLFLGRLLKDNFLGGKMKLYPEKLEFYFNELAKNAGLTSVELALGIIEIAELKMEGAIRVISVERGYDINDFTLVSFGGAGGLHTATIAHRMGIPKVFIPQNPGLLSAMGMLLSDIQLDKAHTCLYKSGKENEIEKMFKQMEDEILDTVEDRESYTVKHYVDMRYEHQAYELTLQYNQETYIQDFHKLHERTYSFKNENMEIEVVTLRIKCIKKTQKIKIDKFKIETSDPQEAYLHDAEFYVFNKKVNGKVYDRDKLKSGNVIIGPALITEYSSTTLIPPEDECYVDEYLNLIITIN